jgi:outer membrane beta-barrel protein
MKYFLAAILLILASSPAFGEMKINFPEEELATESVLPKFEEKSAIKNRNVKHAGRFELNLMGGMVASEALYSPFNFGGSLTYHFDNTHAIHVMATFFLGGLNDNGEALKNGDVFLADGSAGQIRFDAEEAPNKEMLLAAHYQYTAYYGKISLTGDVVMNLTLSALLGGGAYIMGDLIAPAANVGISQRFYFNSKFALRFDIILSAFNGVDITSAGPLNPTDNVVPDAEDFDRSVQFDSNLFFGLSILL